MEKLKNFSIPDHIDLSNPDFDKKNKVHDWRNHVPEELVKSWSSLTEREKRIIYFMAKTQADNEEWD